MKNWKQSVFFGMVAIIALCFGFIGCDDGDGKDDLCKCDPKEHYFPCNCGGSDCTCKELPNAYSIPIIGNGDIVVTEAHIATIIAAIDDIGTWGEEYIPQMNYIKNNVKEFRIISGGGATLVGMEDGKLIVKISTAILGLSTAGAVSEIAGALQYYVELNVDMETL
jgi:hypothetical protein